MIVFDIRFNILTSGNATIAGDPPHDFPVALRNRGTTYGNSWKPLSANGHALFPYQYKDANGIFLLSCFVRSRLISWNNNVKYFYILHLAFLKFSCNKISTLSMPNLCTACLAGILYFRNTVSTIPN